MPLGFASSEAHSGRGPACAYFNPRAQRFFGLSSSSLHDHSAFPYALLGEGRRVRRCASGITWTLCLPRFSARAQSALAAASDHDSASVLPTIPGYENPDVTSNCDQPLSAVAHARNLKADGFLISPASESDETSATTSRQICLRERAHRPHVINEGRPRKYNVSQERNRSGATGLQDYWSNGRPGYRARDVLLAVGGSLPRFVC